VTLEKEDNWPKKKDAAAFTHDQALMRHRGREAEDLLAELFRNTPLAEAVVKEWRANIIDAIKDAIANSKEAGEGRGATMAGAAFTCHKKLNELLNAFLVAHGLEDAPLPTF